MKTLIISLLGFLPVLLFSQPDLLLELRKHNIKEVVINKSEKFSYEYHDGMILEKEPATENGNFVHHYYYFNSENKVDSIVSHTKEGEYSIVSTNYFSYNEKGLVKSIRSKNNNIIIKKKFVYNALGQLDTMMIYKNDYKEIFGNNATLHLKPKEGFKFLNNSDNLPIMEEQVLPENADRKTMYSYNSKNQLIKKITDFGKKDKFDKLSTDEILHVIEYKYNKLGLKKKVTETYFIIKDDGKSLQDSQVKLKYKYLK